MFHYKSFDELSSQKTCKNHFCEKSAHFHNHQNQWPKTISPSSYSANSFNFNRHSLYDESSGRQKMIEEFDLESIEKERRKSHTNLFENHHHQNDLNLNYGTAV